MNTPRQLLVREIQLAYSLGFTEIDAFRRALRNGEVPQPNEHINGKAVWYVVDLERRYGVGVIAASTTRETDVIAAVDGY
ncbi:MAG: hypothetical protein ACR2RF_15940 [Geminicoccaceae bacterium]